MNPTITGNRSLADDDRVDLLDHVDPRSPSFFSEAAAVAACVVNGKGKSLESSRGLVAGAIMQRVILAARENRPCFLAEIQDALEEASGYLHCHKNIETIVGRTTKKSLASKQTLVEGLPISAVTAPSPSNGLLADGFPS